VVGDRSNGAFMTAAYHPALVLGPPQTRGAHSDSGPLAQ
jgi:hypothetical protein